MEYFRAITSNYILNVGVTSWVLAQLIKTVLTLITTRKLVLERLIGSGGMPSSHSALVCSIALGMAKKVGFASPEFGLALAFAGVVMYDAMGVRRAAGEQAKVLNRIVFEVPFHFLERLGARMEKADPDRGRQDRSAQDGDRQDGEREEAPAMERFAETEAAPLLDKELKEYLGHTPLEVAGGCLLGIVVALIMPMV